MTTKQKIRLKALLKKAGGTGLDPIIADQLAFILDEVQRQISSSTGTLAESIIDSNLTVDSLRLSITEQLDLLKAQAKALGTKYDGKMDELSAALTALVSSETARLNSTLRTFIVTLKKKDSDALKKKLAKIQKDIEELYWMRVTNGANNVQAVLNVKSNGTRVASNVIGVNFTSNLTVTDNGDGTVNVAASGGVGGLGTIYTETPIGAVNGSNTGYTTAHTINTILSFAINGQFIHPSDYSVAGSTITFGTPLDASLSGLPFTVIYV